MRMWMMVQGENMPQREQGGCQGKYGMSGYPRILMEGGGGCQWWWRRWLAIPSPPSNSWLDPHTWLNRGSWSNINWCCGQLFNLNINNIETIFTRKQEGWPIRVQFWCQKFSFPDGGVDNWPACFCDELVANIFFTFRRCLHVEWQRCRNDQCVEMTKI